ncbi:helix-turn-helix transcriptional regulator [Novosphingobium sp. G106]|uniref:response regulator transcription factor n=1 Tax=Novosphingobium sp. G106 TaxID=2849500 RepID=UPI001C2D2977|nr:helix-turn-helix transcriptional regulator [Novosphingobium sp. G106]MBV1690321.1 helix-turn-helix transcriptional regulator [Novosphingobium sp. G106]
MRAVEAGSPLTDRELQILGAIADGWSAKEAARTLGITPRTVECHLDTARMKLGARNRTHTVTIALALGLLQHPPHRLEAA